MPPKKVLPDLSIKRWVLKRKSHNASRIKKEVAGMEAPRGNGHRVYFQSGPLGRQLAWGTGLIVVFFLVATGMNQFYLGQIHQTCQELEENLETQKVFSQVSAQITACQQWEAKRLRTTSAQEAEALDGWLAAAKALLGTLAQMDPVAQKRTGSNAGFGKESHISRFPWTTWHKWAYQYVQSILEEWQEPAAVGVCPTPSEEDQRLSGVCLAISPRLLGLEHLGRAVESEKNRLQAASQGLVHRLGFLLVRHRRWTAAWTVVALACVGIALLWMGKHVLGRIRLLTEAAARLAEGKEPLYLHSGTQDELAQLGHQLDRLAEKVSQKPSGPEAKPSHPSSDRQRWSQWMAKCADRVLEPIEKILATNELLLQSVGQPELLPAIYAIEGHAGMVRRMVENVRLWKKLETNSLQPKPRLFSPQQLVSRLGKNAFSLAEAKGLTLRIQWQGVPEETFVSDPELLEKILIHLLFWSIETTEIGCIQLQARTDQRANRQWLEIHLVDTGRGMMPEELLLANGTISGQNMQDQEGPPMETMGWLVCRRLVHLLGGQLDIQSIPGGGTKFTVALPMLEAVASPSERRSLPSWDEARASCPATLPQRLHGRVLLAEDGPENQRLISFLLRKAGLEVDIAANGQEAVERVLQSMDSDAKTPPYDLILMDMLMPVMDGFQAARRLREAGYSGPILAITGLTEEYSNSQCLEAGCTDYLIKPFEREKLLGLVAKYLSTPSPKSQKTRVSQTSAPVS